MTDALAATTHNDQHDENFLQTPPQIVEKNLAKTKTNPDRLFALGRNILLLMADRKVVCSWES